MKELLLLILLQFSALVYCQDLHSLEVTLQIVSGPGEFPTGSSITFSNDSDIYIRDGKAAIEFRSYFGGKTLIKAISRGLQSDSIIIETKGFPFYIEGESP
jgi:beta-galactosidase